MSMRIGIEAQRIFRQNKHGMDIVALELIRHLQQTDLENEYIIFAKPDVDNGVLTESANLRIVLIPGGPYPYWEQILLPREIKKQRIQLVHCTSNTAPLTLPVPMVLTLHDIIYLEQWNFTRGSWYQIIGNLYRRWNVPRAVSKAARIITVSHFEHRRICDHFNLAPEKIVTAHNGVGSHFRRVNDEVVLSYIKKKYTLPDHFVFFLGNTDPKKNVEGVLRALSILEKKDRLDFHVIMPDIDRDYIRQKAEQIGNAGIVKHLHFTGYIPNEELPVIYSLAELFLYPSLRESFGIPILEAMACETPVLTSDTSSMPEVAGDAAIIVDPFKPEQIADGILRGLHDAVLRQQLIKKGKGRSARFSWQRNAEVTLDVYRSVMESNASIQSGND